MSGLREKLAGLLNSCSAENGSDTPDFILADYLLDCLAAFDKATKFRDHGRQTLSGSKPILIHPIDESTEISAATFSANKIILSAITLPEAFLHNWCITAGGQLIGDVYGHRRFPNGKEVRTSRIVTDCSDTRKETRNTAYTLVGAGIDHRGAPLRVSEGQQGLKFNFTNPIDL